MQNYLNNLMTTAIVNEEDTSLLIREYDYSQNGPLTTYNFVFNIYTLIISLGISACFLLESLYPLLISAIAITVKVACLLYRLYRIMLFRRNFYNLIRQMQDSRDLFTCVAAYWNNRAFVPNYNIATKYVRIERYFLKLFLDSLIEITSALQLNLCEIWDHCPTEQIQPYSIKIWDGVYIDMHIASKERVFALFQNVLQNYRTICSHMLCLVGISSRNNYKRHQFYRNQKNFNTAICNSAAKIMSIIPNLREEFVKVQFLLSEFIFAMPLLSNSSSEAHEKSSTTSEIVENSEAESTDFYSWSGISQTIFLVSKVSVGTMTEFSMFPCDTSDSDDIFLMAELDKSVTSHDTFYEYSEPGSIEFYSCSENSKTSIIGSKISVGTMTDFTIVPGNASEVNTIISVFPEAHGETIFVTAELDTMHELLIRWKSCIMLNDLPLLEPLCRQTVCMIWHGMQENNYRSRIVNQMTSHTISYFLSILRKLLGDSGKVGRGLRPRRAGLYWSLIKSDSKFIINAFLKRNLKAMEDIYQSANVIDKFIFTNQPIAALAEFTSMLQDDMNLCRIKVYMFNIVFEYFGVLVNYADKQEQIIQLRLQATNDCDNKNEASVSQTAPPPPKTIRPIVNPSKADNIKAQTTFPWHSDDEEHSQPDTENKTSWTPKEAGIQNITKNVLKHIPGFTIYSPEPSSMNMEKKEDYHFVPRSLKRRRSWNNDE